MPSPEGQDLQLDDELRQYFRVRGRGEGHVSLAEQRRLFPARWRPLISELAAA